MSNWSSGFGQDASLVRSIMRTFRRWLRLGSVTVTSSAEVDARSSELGRPLNGRLAKKWPRAAGHIFTGSRLSRRNGRHRWRRIAVAEPADMIKIPAACPIQSLQLEICINRSQKFFISEIIFLAGIKNWLGVCTLLLPLHLGKSYPSQSRSPTTYSLRI